MVCVFMLIAGLVFFSQAQSPPPNIAIFLGICGVVLVVAIILNVVNAVSPGGLPTEIIESEQDVPGTKSSAERLQELDGLRSGKLITEAEYAAKRQEILKNV